MHTFYRHRWNSDLFFVYQAQVHSFPCWNVRYLKRWIHGLNIRLIKWLRSNSRPWTTCCVVHHDWVAQGIAVSITNTACDHKSILIWKRRHSKPHVDSGSSITNSCNSLPGWCILDSIHRAWDIEWIKVGIWLIVVVASCCVRAAKTVNRFWYKSATWMIVLASPLVSFYNVVIVLLVTKW